LEGELLYKVGWEGYFTSQRGSRQKREIKFKRKETSKQKCREEEKNRGKGGG